VTAVTEGRSCFKRQFLIVPRETGHFLRWESNEGVVQNNPNPMSVETLSTIFNIWEILPPSFAEALELCYD